ncbi:MAG: hypothetical protein J6N70_06495, partial [Oribacterium sp.]|nr:hypothetical protein [Oribacterium sp.]
NAYLFEVQYVDPKIRSLKNRIRLLDERIARIDAKIQKLQTGLPGICFGTKKLFRMQYDNARYPDHDVWLRTFRKARNKSLAISGRLRNRVTSGFAFSKITMLTESKALKHSVTIRKVSPAYTSQAGKLLYMKKYGMSIHESASVTIGRRAMGIHEKLPDIIKSQLDKDTLSIERYKQWKAAYKILKHIRPQDMYSYRFA